jgi:hypothetical protein
MSNGVVRATHLCLCGSCIPTSKMSKRLLQWEDKAGLSLFRHKPPQDTLPTPFNSILPLILLPSLSIQSSSLRLPQSTKLATSFWSDPVMHIIEPKLVLVTDMTDRRRREGSYGTTTPCPCLLSVFLILLIMLVCSMTWTLLNFNKLESVCQTKLVVSRVSCQTPSDNFV